MKTDQGGDLEVIGGPRPYLSVSTVGNDLHATVEYDLLELHGKIGEAIKKAFYLVAVKAKIVEGCDTTLGYHEYVFTGNAELRDSLGRRNARGAWRTWLVIYCNNGDCPGKALVHELVLGEALAEEMQRR